MSFSRGVLEVAVCAALSLTALSTSPLPGKQKKPVTKTVRGVVIDQSQNPVAGATVELNDVRTGKKIAIYSEDSGRFQFADLQPTHDYEIQASFKGLSSDVRKLSSLDDRTTIVVNLTLSPPH